MLSRASNSRTKRRQRTHGDVTMLTSTSAQCMYTESSLLLYSLYDTVMCNGCRAADQNLMVSQYASTVSSHGNGVNTNDGKATKKFVVAKKTAKNHWSLQSKLHRGHSNGTAVTSFGGGCLRTLPANHYPSSRSSPISSPTVMSNG